MPNPVKVMLTVGKQYNWCGLRGQWLCEGPIENCKGEAFTADRTEAFICTCKQTKTPPYCDGFHKTVKDE